MTKRTYYLSLLLLFCFVLMFVFIFFKFSPNNFFLLLGALFLVALLFFAYQLKKDALSNTEKNSNKYLPFLLNKSRTLRVIFASLALSLIISVILFPFCVFIFGLESVIAYIENYFLYQNILLGLLLLPFVARMLDD